MIKMMIYLYKHDITHTFSWLFVVSSLQIAIVTFNVKMLGGGVLTHDGGGGTTKSIYKVIQLLPQCPLDLDSLILLGRRQSYCLYTIPSHPLKLSDWNLLEFLKADVTLILKDAMLFLRQKDSQPINAVGPASTSVTPSVLGGIIPLVFEEQENPASNHNT